MFTILALLLLVLALIGCDKTGDVPASLPKMKVEQSYPDYQDAEKITDQSMVWTPHYSLSKGQSSSWSQWLVVVPVSSDGPDIWVSIEPVNSPWQDSSAESLRDDLYQKLYCQGQDSDQVFLNCHRGFQRYSKQMGGKEVFLLSYFGSSRDRDEAVTELLFSTEHFPVRLTVEGDLGKATPALEELIASLRFSLDPLNLPSP